MPLAPEPSTSAASQGPSPSPATRSTVRRRLSNVLDVVTERRFIALLLILFVARGVIVTFVHPPFSGHDEVMHYSYLEYVARDFRPPVIPELAEWQELEREGRETEYDRANADLWPYCEYVTKDWNIACWKFPTPTWKAVLAGDYFPMGWVYTANHPPLYYLYLTPFFLAADDLSIEDQLSVFRLATIPFGIATVVLAWLTARTLFGRDRFLVLMVPTVVAFQPQITYESAMLNNDIMAIAFTSAVFYLLARGLKHGFPWGNVALIGFCYGLAVLSKNTALTTGAIIAFAMVLGIGVRKWREWLARGVVSAAVGALLIWPWYLYVYRTYGDFTGLSRIQSLQHWNYASKQFPTIWQQLESRNFLWWRWKETWGEFGWRKIPLSTELLTLVFWVCLIAAIGIGVWAVRLYLTQRQEISSAVLSDNSPRSEREPLFRPERWQVVGVLTMGVACFLAYLAILQFGTTFSLTQARYYFPAIIPAAVLFALGWRSLLPRQWLIPAQVALFFALVLLNVVIYTAYVIPYWELGT